MLLLIDGYNLLHQSDVLGRSRAEGWLHRARMRLLRTIGQHLDPELRRATCIVFDAQDPPPGRPSQESFEQIDVRYAVDYPEADDLLEELIAHHAAPGRLTVISSDHRVQRAIHRRRGFFFDSDVWYAKLIDGGPPLGIAWMAKNHERASQTATEKPSGKLDAEEASEWLKAFGIADRKSPLPDSQPLSASPGGGSTSEVGGVPPKAEKRSGAKETGHREGKPVTKAKPAAKAKRAAKAKPAAKRKPVSSRNEAPPGKIAPKASKPSARDRLGSPRRNLDEEGNNPFPEGYGEDLL